MDWGGLREQLIIGFANLVIMNWGIWGLGDEGVLGDLGKRGLPDFLILRLGD